MRVERNLGLRTDCCFSAETLSHLKSRDSSAHLTGFLQGQSQGCKTATLRAINTVLLLQTPVGTGIIFQHSPASSGLLGPQGTEELAKGHAPMIGESLTLRTWQDVSEIPCV